MSGKKAVWEQMMEDTKKPLESTVETPLETEVVKEVEEVKDEVVEVEVKRGRPAKEVVKEEVEEVVKEEETTTDAETFYSELFAITGDNSEEIDFGNIDPLSPQGVAKFVEYKEEQIQKQLEEHLSKNAPIEYQALLMRLEGKDPSSLYDKTGFVDYSKLEIPEDNVDLQRDLIRKDMDRQGISKERQDKLIKMLENEGELFEESIKSQSNLADSQKQQLVEESNRAKIEKETYDKNVNQFLSVINNTVGKGEVGNFTISDKDKKPFYDFVRSNVRYVDGEFISMTPISNDNFDKVMQNMFFAYKGGNLKDLVEKQARTQGVVRLRTAAANAKNLSSAEEIASKSKPQGKSWREDIGL